MFLLQRSEYHAKETKVNRIKYVAKRFPKVGKVEQISNALRDMSLFRFPDRPFPRPANFCFIDVQHNIM